MKIIQSGVELVEEKNPLVLIEKVGRTCYKSESEFTNETAIKFFNMLVSQKHFAMLEHANFVFEVTPGIYDSVDYPFMHKTTAYITDTEDSSLLCVRRLVSMNLRAINEMSFGGFRKALLNAGLKDLVYSNGDIREYCIKLIDFDALENVTPEEVLAHKYFSFRIVCDRGVSHEIVRHRVASFAQESTRYCNYSNDRFGNELTFIEPSTLMSWDENSRERFYNCLEDIEGFYMKLLDSGLAPQQARAILPNSLKTEIVMTANAKEFEHFFNLRYRGTTGSPHPDMKKVAEEMYGLFKTEISKYNFSI